MIDISSLTRVLLLLVLSGTAAVVRALPVAAQDTVVAADILMERWTGSALARLETVIYRIDADRYEHRLVVQPGSGDNSLLAAGYGWSVILARDGQVISQLRADGMARGFLAGGRANIKTVSRANDIAAAQYASAAVMLSRVVLCGEKPTLNPSEAGNGCEPRLRQARSFIAGLPQAYQNTPVDRLVKEGWSVVRLDGAGQ